ncbi:MAG: hypothetical protein KBA61_19640 [Spirochaetes bacterium]|nr:hypothetical protein [Spirochaetota bacterium]
MRSLITALILALAGTLSCGMMEDFYEYSGKDFKTMIVAENMQQLYVSYDRGASFSNLPLNQILFYWHVNPFGEIITIEQDPTNWYVYVTYPDGVKKLVFTIAYSDITMKAVTADINGDFYFCFYNTIGPEQWLFRIPSGEYFAQPVSQMPGFGGEEVPDWNLWIVYTNGNRLLFANNTSTSALYTSIDGGMTFNAIPSPPTGTTTGMISDHSAIYAITNEASNAFYRSIDGGNNFIVQATHVDPSLALAASNSGRIFTTTTSRISYSDDSGINWIIGMDLGATMLSSLATDHTGRLYVLSESSGGLVVSDDGGITPIYFNPGFMGIRMQVVEYQD